MSKIQAYHPHIITMNTWIALLSTKLLIPRLTLVTGKPLNAQQSNSQSTRRLLIGE